MERVRAPGPGGEAEAEVVLLVVYVVQINLFRQHGTIAKRHVIQTQPMHSGVRGLLCPRIPPLLSPTHAHILRHLDPFAHMRTHHPTPIPDHNRKFLPPPS